MFKYFSTLKPKHSPSTKEECVICSTNTKSRCRECKNALLCLSCQHIKQFFCLVCRIAHLYSGNTCMHESFQEHSCEETNVRNILRPSKDKPIIINLCAGKKCICYGDIYLASWINHPTLVKIVHHIDWSMSDIESLRNMQAETVNLKPEVFLELGKNYKTDERVKSIIDNIIYASKIPDDMAKHFVERVFSKKRSADSCFFGCDETKTMLCGGCGKIRYCSVGCQRAHWSSHKAQCKGKQVPKETESKNKDVKKWSVANVSAWVGSFNSGTRYNLNTLCQSIIETNEIDGEKLLTLKDKDWQDYGLMVAPFRSALCKAIANL